jgi:hypothetical protein
MAVKVNTNSDSSSVQDLEDQTGLKGAHDGKVEHSYKTASAVGAQKYASDDDSSLEVKEVFDVQIFDPVLAKKMALVNKAIDDIGMTDLQWKMFFLNGFGYAVDSVSGSI